MNGRREAAIITVGSSWSRLRVDTRTAEIARYPFAWIHGIRPSASVMTPSALPRQSPTDSACSRDRDRRTRTDRQRHAGSGLTNRPRMRPIRPLAFLDVLGCPCTVVAGRCYAALVLDGARPSTHDGTAAVSRADARRTARLLPAHEMRLMLREAPLIRPARAGARGSA
jgi:hypothetical protein